MKMNPRARPPLARPLGAAMIVAPFAAALEAEAEGSAVRLERRQPGV